MTIKPSKHRRNSASIHKKGVKENKIVMDPTVDRRFFIRLVLPCFFLVFLLYAFVSVQLHNRFMTFGLDLGYFDEAIWKMSQFIFPYSGIGCIWLLEDHFQPILALLAPLYWLWSDARVLLVAQSFLMVAAAIPVYLLSMNVTKHRWFSSAVCFSYLFFIGTQWSILNEYHQVTFAPLFLGLTYLSLETKQRKLFWISIVGLLLIKEDLSLLVASIGAGLVFRPDLRRTGITLILLGGAWFLILTKWLMPAISVKGVYAHFSHLDFGPLGKTPLEVLKTLATKPWMGIVVLVSPVIKLQTLITSLATFAFLPLLAPIAFLIPLILDFVFRFIYAGPQVTKWMLVNHHAAVSGMLLSITAIYAAQRINRHYLVMAGALFSTTIMMAVVLHAPLNSVAKRQFWIEESWIQDVREVISRVPDGVSLAAQNNILPHVAHRNAVYRIPYGLNSDYMVVDLRDGPNKYAPLSHAQMRTFVQDLLDQKRYTIVYQKGEAMLLKRLSKTDITKSPYYGDTRFCYYSWEDR